MGQKKAELMTFKEMVSQEVKMKKEFHDSMKACAGEEVNYFIPAELLSKVGKDPAFSDKKHFAAASQLKKICGTGTIRRIDNNSWQTLKRTETLAYREGQVEYLTIEDFHVIEDTIAGLVKSCSNLTFANKDPKEQEYFNRCMKLGERLWNLQKEYLEHSQK